MCSSGEETIDHLFFECQFAQNCWAAIGVSWDTDIPLLDRVSHARTIHAVPMFIEVVLIAAWEIWKARNDKVFRQHSHNPSTWLNNFVSQCTLQSMRFTEDARTSFCVWLDAFS
ncbi:hypothetical protein BS78_K154600 [Paspalum vaginatum]|uniref:Reverse transcriptase zinc-binding domain-containing protein n=1 Tax=Paspalum vaginatum TaxID=158149 RepID=A0A9W8CFH4_9POAL|nr:hypothetical protein BS78_K154600 [Paspalum vaginatum]